jgi:hypothetical protein
MLQANRMSSKDPISLEGFEKLLDRAFKPHVVPGKGRQMSRSNERSAPNLVALNVTHISTNDQASPLPAAVRTVSDEDWSTADNEVVAAGELKAEILLLKARLDYAFKELEQARVKEKRLMTKLASMEDQIRVIPELFSKAVRLRELEHYLTRLTVRLSKKI